MGTALRSITAALLFLPCAGHAGDAAFLFAYRPNPGQGDAFDAGYREHLAWHRRHADPLPWYGWYVVTGERTGLFVDGSFGISFEAFDGRIEPTADGADFAAHVAPYGATAWRKTLRRLPIPGTAARLEARDPSAVVEVLTVRVQPGRADVFEACLAELAEALRQAPQAAEFTAYRQLSGGADPAYLVMFPRDGEAWFERYTPSLDALLDAHPDAGVRRKLRAMLADSVREVQVEAWQYREDLSYLEQATDAAAATRGARSSEGPSSGETTRGHAGSVQPCGHAPQSTSSVTSLSNFWLPRTYSTDSG